MSTITPPAPALAGSVRAVLVIAHRDLLRQARQPGTLVSQALQIVFFVLVYAIGFDSMIGAVDGVAFSAYVFPGIIAIQVVTFGVSAGLSYAWDREYGVLRDLLLAPVPRICLPLGKIVATAALLGTQSVVMLLFAPLFGLPLTPVSFVVTGVAFTASAAVFSVLGLFLAMVIKRVETLQSVVQLAMYPMLFLSGSVFRTQDTPAWLAAAIQLNPMTYAVDLARQTLFGGIGSAAMWLDCAVLLAVAGALGTVVRLRTGR
ncbi:MAG: ABC transporter permease [Pseudonocardiaceae bacterium]